MPNYEEIEKGQVAVRLRKACAALTKYSTELRKHGRVLAECDSIIANMTLQDFAQLAEFADLAFNIDLEEKVTADHLN